MVLEDNLSMGAAIQTEEDTHLRSDISEEDEAKTWGLRADMLSIPDRGWRGCLLVFLMGKREANAVAT